MKFEHILKNFSPKSVLFAEPANCTSPNKMTNSDIVVAMGMMSQQAKFGLVAFLAKNDISEKDIFATIEELALYAVKTAPKLVRKAAGNKLSLCMLLLAKIAFEDYARSAGSIQICSHCSGKGLLYGMEEVVKHPGIMRSDGKLILEPNVNHEMVSIICQRCNGKGVITHRCRCKGRGRILDKKQTMQQAVEVMKNCPYCSGRGYKRVPSTVAFNLVKQLIPDLTQSSWSRNWMFFYQNLVDKCYIEEAIAEQAFNKVTK